MKKIPLISTLITLFMLLLTWFMLFPLLVNKNTIKTELQAYFQNVAGMQLEIQGDVTVKMDLMPHIIVSKLYVINIPGTRNPFFLTINSADIYPVFSSIFTNKTQLKTIVLNNVFANIEVSKEGKENWRQLSSYWNDKSGQSAMHLPANDVRLEINSGAVSYSNGVTQKDYEFDGINSTLDISSASNENEINGQFNYSGNAFAVSAKLSGDITKILTTQKRTANVTITSGKTLLSYNGSASFDKNPLLNGELKFESDDFAEWVQYLRGDYSKKVTDKDYQKLPILLKTHIDMNNDNIMEFPDIILSGDIINAKANIKYALPSSIEIDSDISSLNLETLSNNGVLFASKEPEKLNRNTTSSLSVDMEVDKGLPLSVAANVRLDDIAYNARHIKKVNLSLEYDNGDIVISQLLASLPGESLLAFSGLGRNSISGLVLEGQIDLQGTAFHEMINLFKMSQISLPPEDFKRFHLKGNTLLSAKELRISELAARIEQIGVVGGLIIKFGTIPSLQSALNITSLNLDHFVKFWDIDGWQKAFLSNNRISNRSGVIAVMLQNLGYEILANTSFENYILGEKSYSKANIDMGLSRNKLDLKGVEAEYNGTKISGKMAIDVSKEIPKVTFEANLSQLDINNFFHPSDLNSNSPSTKPSEKWSKETFDFTFLSLFNGSYKVKIGKLINNLADAIEVEAEGAVNERKLTVSKFIATTTGNAHVSATGFLSGGTIPSLNIQSVISSFRPELFTNLLPMLKVMTGNINFSFNLSTTGISAVSWVSNLDGSFAINGRDIEIHEFNLPGIIRAVTYVRTVADILNVVKRAFPSGNTIFPKMEGQWSVSKGIMETSNSRIYNSQADGLIVSNFDLVNWNTKNNITFSLKSLNAVDTPTMTVSVYGDADMPKIDFDTRSLEQFVNNKTSENLLNEYGTQK